MSEKLECAKVRTNSLASSFTAEIFTGDEAKIEKAKANTNKQIEALVAISTPTGLYEMLLQEKL